MRKNILVIFLTFILIISGSVSAFTNSNSEDLQINQIPTKRSTAKWTVMYYMCGDSNMHTYIDPLLENLSDIGSDDDLNIVCLVDKIGYGNSKLIYINETGELIELNEVYGWPDEVDMGNLNTFELFCTLMMGEFPAKYYGLVIYASGGGGWQGYHIGDYDSDKHIAIPDFANSLKNIVNETGHKIDVFIGSCAINMIENAYEFQPYVDYFVGTQDCFPHTHVVPMFYKALIDLKNNKDFTPEDFAKSGPMQYEPVTFDYNEGYGYRIPFINKLLNKLPFKRLHSVVHHSNLGAINLSEINNLTTNLNELASYLILNIKDTDILKSIKNTRKQVCELAKCGTKFPLLYRIFTTYRFEFLAYDCYVDLYDLVSLLKENIQNEIIKSKCDNVLEKINQTIAYVAKNNNASTYGLNIYFPQQKFMYNKYKSTGKIPSPYENLKFSKDTCWDEFLKNYYIK